MNAHYTGGRPVVEWLEDVDGRLMQLTRPFGFIDASGTEWDVPTGTKIDGASIPRVFWSLIGGPFEENYRDASIIHDCYCDNHARQWQRTHRMFHEAMLCSGVNALKAKLMFYAVYRFGPRWPPPGDAAMAGVERAEREELFDRTSFVADALRIIDENPSIDTIVAMAEATDGGCGSPMPAALESASMPTLEAGVIDAELSKFSRSLASPLANPLVGVEAAQPFDALKDGYEQLFASCQVNPARAAQVERFRQTMLAMKPRYETVSKQTGVPWWFIGVIHGLEASFNFNGHLHNGDPLSNRTVHVPKGRPQVWNPPSDWESSARDALDYEGFSNQLDWTLARSLYRWEAYNGFGYRSHGIDSPYLWSYSNHYTAGKYTTDGIYDSHAVSAQCGAGMALKSLVEHGDVTI